MFVAISALCGYRSNFFAAISDQSIPSSPSAEIAQLPGAGGEVTFLPRIGIFPPNIKSSAQLRMYETPGNCN